VEKDTEEEADPDRADRDEVSKEAGGLDISDPSGGFDSETSEAVEKSADVDSGDTDERADFDLPAEGGDGDGETVEKSVPSEAPALDLDKSGSFLSRKERLLGEICDALSKQDEDVRVAVEKAVKDATKGDGNSEASDDGDSSEPEGDAESGGEGDLADAYEAMLLESEAVVEDAEVLVDADADDNWSDLKERVNGLIQRMEDVPAPETPEEAAAVEIFKERAATVADIIDPDESGDSNAEASGDREGDDD